MNHVEFGSIHVQNVFIPSLTQTKLGWRYYLISIFIQNILSLCLFKPNCVEDIISVNSHSKYFYHFVKLVSIHIMHFYHFIKFVSIHIQNIVPVHRLELNYVEDIIRVYSHSNMFVISLTQTRLC